MNRKVGFQAHLCQTNASPSTKHGVTRTFVALFSLLVIFYTSFSVPTANSYGNGADLPHIPEGLHTEARLQQPMLPPAANGGLLAELMPEEPGSGFGGNGFGIATLSIASELKGLCFGTRSAVRQAAVYAGAYLRKILYPFHYFT